MKPSEKLKLVMGIIDKQKGLLELYETMIKEYAETIEEQKKEITGFQCTFTVRFMGHWLTITMADATNILVRVDGKPVNHPDNKDIDLGYITISAMSATEEQIEIIHKKNKEWYGMKPSGFTSGDYLDTPNGNLDFGTEDFHSDIQLISKKDKNK